MIRPKPPRVLADVFGREPGALVVAVAGLHGNEPAGLDATQTVADRLRPLVDRMRGRFLAVSGNRGALALGVRARRDDLNRRFRSVTLRGLSADDSPEAEEQRELLAVLDQAAASTAGPMILVDLHSMSAPGPPFVVIGDTMRNRRFASSLPLPVVLGLEECLSGTLIEFLNSHGHVALAIEGGRHDDPATERRHAAVLSLLVHEAGLISASDFEIDSHRAILSAASVTLPRVLEIVHREALAERHHFVMEPGFASFDRVQAGRLLARDGDRIVRAERDSLILMPLYQSQGRDGFFLARPVWRGWLTLARWVRVGPLARWLTWLPGVRTSRRDPDLVLVHRRVARFLTLQIFHLFGYRRSREFGDVIAFFRRRPDGLPILRWSRPGCGSSAPK